MLVKGAIALAAAFLMGAWSRRLSVAESRALGYTSATDSVALALFFGAFSIFSGVVAVNYLAINITGASRLGISNGAISGNTLEPGVLLLVAAIPLLAGRWLARWAAQSALSRVSTAREFRLPDTCDSL